MCKDAADFALRDIRIRFFVSNSCRAYQQITYPAVTAGIYNCTSFWFSVTNNFCLFVAQYILFEIRIEFLNTFDMKFSSTTINSYLGVNPVSGSLLCRDVRCTADLVGGP
jgi:hypothetical protein